MGPQQSPHQSVARDHRLLGSWDSRTRCP